MSSQIMQNHLNFQNDQQSIIQTIDQIIQEIDKQISTLNKPKSSIKIAVAMSGGVDSSVCPIFFQQAGYSVEGITLKLYENKHEREGACCSFRDVFDAKRVAQQFNFPHYVINYEKQFKEQVIDRFIEDYVSGKTPIPCVQCNQKIKFNYMFELIKNLEFDFLVTGHYIIKKTLEANKQGLFMANDKTKDQSYFLYNLTSEQINHLLFPLGKLNKNQTREIAQYFGIKTSKKPDSQDICFVEDGSYRNFIEQHKTNLEDYSGELIDIESGKILGKHQGIYKFTIGQRKGLGISSDQPLYVIKIDENTKQVFVGPKQQLACYQVSFHQTSWVNSEDMLNYLQNNKEMKVEIRLRSMHRNLPAILAYDQNKQIYTAKLYNPEYFVCPGQACVVYQGQQLLGGGTIL